MWEWGALSPRRSGHEATWVQDLTPYRDRGWPPTKDRRSVKNPPCCFPAGGTCPGPRYEPVVRSAPQANRGTRPRGASTPRPRIVPRSLGKHHLGDGALGALGRCSPQCAAAWSASSFTARDSDGRCPVAVSKCTPARRWPGRGASSLSGEEPSGYAGHRGATGQRHERSRQRELLVVAVLRSLLVFGFAMRRSLHGDQRNRDKDQNASKYEEGNDQSVWDTRA
jgi:hypothetical protein